jgi:hypothetical protein
MIETLVKLQLNYIGRGSYAFSLKIKYGKDENFTNDRPFNSLSHMSMCHHVTWSFYHPLEKITAGRTFTKMLITSFLLKIK